MERKGGEAICQPLAQLGTVLSLRLGSLWAGCGSAAATSRLERPDEGGEGRGFAEQLTRVCSGELWSGLSA